MVRGGDEKCVLRNFDTENRNSVLQNTLNYRFKAVSYLKHQNKTPNTKIKLVKNLKSEKKKSLFFIGKSLKTIENSLKINDIVVILDYFSWEFSTS